ncbi:hypothetical protein ACKGJO_02435 [Gracilimonas sp. Q87]|uniref:hypothetical protein n=1 Tax=Gracilimonas sp. Q87 TaxID=3384766 RepID=UPI00398448E6
MKRVLKSGNFGSLCLCQDVPAAYFANAWYLRDPIVFRKLRVIPMNFPDQRIKLIGVVGEFPLAAHARMGLYP